MGIRIAQGSIAAVLDSCLLTVEEVALGSRAWVEWTCPWDMLDV